MLVSRSLSLCAVSPATERNDLSTFCDAVEPRPRYTITLGLVPEIIWYYAFLLNCYCYWYYYY